MSHPTPELQLEVDIFEKLEVRASLTLGRLTQLRRLSREAQKNLLVVAYEQGCVRSEVARDIARELSLTLPRAPWGTQGDEGRARGSEGSLAEPQVSHTSLAESPVYEQSLEHALASAYEQPYAPSKRAHGALDPKTHIEIGLPHTLSDASLSSTPASVPPSLSSPSASIFAHDLTSQAPPLGSAQRLAAHMTPSPLPHSPTPTPTPSPNPSPLPTARSSRARFIESETLLVPNPSHIEHNTLDQDSTPTGLIADLLSELDLSETQGEKKSETQNKTQSEVYTRTFTFELEAREGALEDWSSEGGRALIQSEEVRAPHLARSLTALSPAEGRAPWEVSVVREGLLQGYQALTKVAPSSGAPHVYALQSEAGEGAPVLLSVEHAQPLSLARRPLTHECAWLRSITWLWQLTYLIRQAHERDVVHLGLSPHSISASETGVYLSHWESARCLDERGGCEVPHTLLRSAEAWWAPEVRALGVGGRLERPKATDVYTLGALGFWLIFGEPPPSDEREQGRAQERLRAHRFASEHLIQGLCSALAWSPHERLRDAQQLQAALFGALTLPQRHVTERETSEVNLTSQARSTLIAQLAYDAQLPMSLSAQLSEGPHEDFLGLTPSAWLSFEGFEQADDVTLSPVHQPERTLRDLSPTQRLEPGLYRLRWSLNARHLEWLISLSPLTERTFNLLIPRQVEGWSFVPSGETWVGSLRAQFGERALHRVSLEPYEVSERLVSVAEYTQFLAHLTPDQAMQRAPILNLTSVTQPHLSSVTGVSAEDALAYISWRSQELEGARLLRADEWERAMRGESQAERVDPHQAVLLADAHTGGGELCVSAEGFVLKGGAWSFGVIASQQELSSQVKYPGVGFRLARSLNTL